MDRLQHLARRLLPLLVGVALLAGAALYLAPRFTTSLPWAVAGRRPGAPPQAAAQQQAAPFGQRAERQAPQAGDPRAARQAPQAGDPRAERQAPPQAAPFSQRAERRAAPQAGDPRAARQAPPAPREAGPRPSHREPGHRFGWLWGWVLGSPRQWLSIGLIIAGLWFLGRRNAQRATPSVQTVQAEPVHPETHQPAQEA